MTVFCRKEVEALTGIPARRIQFYTEQGLLPMVEKSTGRGREREYSRDDVFRLAIIKEMADMGISLSKMKVFLNGDVGVMLFAKKSQSILKILQGQRNDSSRPLV